MGVGALVSPLLRLCGGGVAPRERYSAVLGTDVVVCVQVRSHVAVGRKAAIATAGIIVAAVAAARGGFGLGGGSLSLGRSGGSLGLGRRGGSLGLGSRVSSNGGHGGFGGLLGGGLLGGRFGGR